MTEKQVRLKVISDVESTELDALEHKLDALKQKQIDIKTERLESDLKRVTNELNRLKSTRDALATGKRFLNTQDIPKAEQQIRQLDSQIERLTKEEHRIRIRVDDNALNNEIRQTQNQIRNIPKNTAGDAEGAGKKVGERFGAGFKMMMSNFGAMIGFELFGQLTEATKSSLNATSNLEYFGKRMGLSSQRTAEFNAHLEEMQKQYRKVDMTAVGATAEELANKFNIGQENLEGMTELTAVMSSEFVKQGRTQEDAILAVGDALDGEFRRLKEIGVTQDMLKNNGWDGDINNKKGLIEALNKTMDKLGFKQTAQDITDLQGAMQALQVAGGDLLAAVLIPLTPIIISAVEGIISFIDAVKALPDWAKMGALAGGFAAAILLLGGYLYATVPAWIAQATAVWGNVTAFLALELPLGLTVGWLLLLIAIGIALGLAFLYLYNNVDWFRAGVDNLVATLQWLAGVIWNSVVGTIQWLMDLFNQFTAQIGLNTNDWIQAVLGFILFLPQLPLRLGQIFIDAIARALGFGNNFTSNMINSALRAVQGFANAVMGIPRALQNCLNWAYQIVMNNPLVQALQWLGQQAVHAFSILGLGQGSPGDIYGAMDNELKWTSDLVKDNRLIDDTSNLGKDITHAYDPDLANGTSLSSLGAVGGDIIFNLYGDMDEESRMNRFVDAVIRRLNFDNETAGRTV